MKPMLRTIASQPSWLMRTKDVELAVTQLGGHMAPVVFYRRSRRPIQPYYVNPWHDQGLKIDDPVLIPLRGDFFCLPFGAGGEFRGRFHHTHGEPATKRWSLADAEKRGDVTSLVLTVTTGQPPGKVTKRLMLVEGQQVVYEQHVLEGFSGAYSLGHHATLAMPERPETVLVATSPIRFGMTNPAPTGDPSRGRYQALAINKRFSSLSRVLTIWNQPRYADCSSFPTRRGFTDIISVLNKPSPTPAWTAATYVNEGFLWFSLKDPSVLPMTLVWMANCGRHDCPWNGRERCLGLEDVRAFFAAGLGPSLRPNSLSRMGIPTAMKLSPDRPTTINYIQGVVKTPPGFGRVSTARFASGSVTFVSESGKKVTTAVRHEFLTTGGFD
jgi:hypothetical protein